MKKNCEHILSLKTQRVSNFIKKTQIRCKKTHEAAQYNLCLNCGQTRCGISGNPDNKNICSFQHYSSYGHPLILQLFSLQIYCFCCESFVLDFDSESGSKLQKKKIERIIQMNDKILNLANKFLNVNKLQPKNKDAKHLMISTKQEKMQKKKKIESKQQNKMRVFGLTNNGNTCYFNSILQCLYATNAVHQLFDTQEFKDDFNIVFRKFLTNKEKVYCPKTILSRLCKDHKHFKGMNQQDAFQLFIFLLNSLIESAVKNSHPGNNLGSIFGFNLVSKLQCLNCKNIKWIKDFSSGICIPLNKKTKKLQKKQEEQQYKVVIPENLIGEQGLIQYSFKPTYTFLDGFFSPQNYTKLNSYVCEKCQESNAIHRFFIKDPPPVLVVNFKRFHNNGAKNDTNISIPNKIQVQNCCLNGGNNLQYQIYGSVVHTGNSRGGHYIAYTKRGQDWFYFSDQNFKPANFSTVKSNNPYILFYKKVYKLNKEQPQNSSMKVQQPSKQQSQ